MESTIERRSMTWEERVHWVMKNTDVEWENFYIVEEIAKDTTPKTIITSTVKDYEGNVISREITYE